MASGVPLQPEIDAVDPQNLVAEGLIHEAMAQGMTRRELFGWAVALGLGGSAMAMILAACGATPAATPGGATVAPGGATAAPGGASPASGGPVQRLLVASGADAVTLDPGISFDGQSPLLWRAAYEPLVQYKGNTTEIIPHLAEKFEVSPDKLTYTFTIRQGVTFHDGEPFNAAAVKANIDRQIKLNQGIAFGLAPVASVETPDAWTVVVKLKSFVDGFLSVFAGMYTVRMISPKVLAANATDLAQGYLHDHMVGTGPYKLDSYTQSQQALFSRNDQYWGGWDGSHLSQIAIQYVHEPSSEQLQLQQGSLDVAMFLPDDSVESLDGRPGISVTNVPSYNLYYLYLPCKKGPTANKAVRQAISYGFDYGTWINDIMKGKAVQAHGPIPSDFPGYAKDLPQYSFQPDKARQMLAQAGYPNGGFTLKYTYETGYFWKRPLGELFQSNMKDLGITVEIQELSPSAWAAQLSNPETAEHAFGVVWWPTIATPFDYLWSLFATSAQGTAGYNWGYYSSPEFDKILTQANSESDDVKRAELYAKCQRLVVEDAPALFVYEKNYRLPMRSNVQGFQFNGIYIETLNFHEMSKV